MKNRVVILSLVLAAIGWFFAAVKAKECKWLLADRAYHYEVIDALEQRVPTIAEIQQKVGAEPDGILGAETIKKWERAVCNQHAAQWFRKGENR